MAKKQTKKRMLQITSKGKPNDSKFLQNLDQTKDKSSSKAARFADNYLGNIKGLKKMHSSRDSDQFCLDRGTSQSESLSTLL